MRRKAAAERAIPTSGRFRRTSGACVPVSKLDRIYVSICHMKRTTVFIPEALELTKSPDWKDQQLRGVHLQVLEAGNVGIGDEIVVLSRSE